MLTEHSLYTVEAWRSFLEHLQPGGILTVTRFYFPENPATAYRLVGLATRALEAQGVETPREHIALVWLPAKSGAMCTLLVSADPLSAADLDRLDALVAPRLRDRLSPRTRQRIFRAWPLRRPLHFYARSRSNLAAGGRPPFLHMLVCARLRQRSQTSPTAR